MQEIELSKGLKTQVDDDIHEELMQHRWYASHHGPYSYAVSHLPMINRKPGKYLYMHRVVMKASPDEYVDHRDMNTLNNQRSNLRICTHQENLRNRKSIEGSTSRFKGVCWDTGRGKWMATIKEDIGKQKYLGRFDAEIEAAVAYDKACVELFGQFARINFTKHKQLSLF